MAGCRHEMSPSYPTHFIKPSASNPLSSIYIIQSNTPYHLHQHQHLLITYTNTNGSSNFSSNRFIRPKSECHPTKSPSHTPPFLSATTTTPAVAAQETSLESTQRTLLLAPMPVDQHLSSSLLLHHRTPCSPLAVAVLATSTARRSGQCSASMKSLHSNDA